ncbi:hypothetical protein B4U79_18779 [Dinothrombium tinctorium]|uniref:FCP1 homology domain-containing protein n=1 Tax=Dinothrombium tinctorium TaxID=1965070 RepID=A0A3S3PEQ2_9ACAR|nr:hypothetical protein B4U79_18779 [Dinothrombium tinctorium]
MSEINPLLIVFDLDNTIIYCDEERKLSENHSKSQNLNSKKTKIFFRKETPFVFSFLRKWFGKNLAIVLWSTGDNDYVRHCVQFFKLYEIDFILGRKESEESFYKYKAYKSPQYLLYDHSETVQWIEKTCSEAKKIPNTVLIDDLAYENTQADDQYDLMYAPPPLDLKALYYDKRKNKLLAKTVSLFRYVHDILNIVTEDNKKKLLKKHLSIQNNCKSRLYQVQTAVTDNEETNLNENEEIINATRSRVNDVNINNDVSNEETNFEFSIQPLIESVSTREQQQQHHSSFPIETNNLIRHVHGIWGKKPENQNILSSHRIQTPIILQEIKITTPQQ